MGTDKRVGIVKSSARTLFIVAGICLAGTIALGCKQKTDSKGAVSETAPQAVVPHDPIKAKEHFEKGVNHSMNKEYDKAIVEYSESIRYNPGVAAAHSNLAFAYADSGNTDMAVKEHQRALEIDPAYANSYYGIAMIYEALGNKAEAIKSWEEFIKHTEPHGSWWDKAQQRLERLKSEK